MIPVLGDLAADRRRRVVLAVALSGLVSLTATAMSQQAAPVQPGAPQQVTLRPGDSMVVDGVPIGCAVTRRDGAIVIECGRTGKVAGTYMAIVGRRTLKVARLRSAAVAKIVFSATHWGGYRVCGVSAGAARSGASGCR
jgi:ribosomal protein L2